MGKLQDVGYGSKSREMKVYWVEKNWRSLLS